MSFLKASTATKLEMFEGAVEAQAGDQVTEAVILDANPVYPLVVDPAQTDAAEHFSLIRARLLNAYAKTGHRSFIVTSPEKKEGKSLVSSNVAISIAQLGKYRVLLVDGDLRVKGLSELLGIVNQNGLSEFLQNAKTFETCIRPTNLPFLSVASAGNVPTGSLPALLEGERWPQFIERAKQQFEIIIVDTVPVGVPIADFELLSAATDGVILVVHVRKTSRDALTASVERMNGKLVGAVINNSQSEGYKYDYGKKNGTR